MAGFVAANVLRGDAAALVRRTISRCKRQTACCLMCTQRVRTCALAYSRFKEYSSHPIARGRLSELPRDKQLLVYCRTGFRSYLAVRILTQAGFTRVATLSGGSMTFSAVHKKQSLGHRLHPEVAHGNASTR